jgi:hypothetical protein
MWAKAKNYIGDSISDTYESLMDEFREDEDAVKRAASPLYNKIRQFAQDMDTQAQSLLTRQQPQQPQQQPQAGSFGPAIGPLALSTALRDSSVPQVLKSVVDSSVYPDPATSFLPPAGTAIGSVVGPFPGVKDLVARLAKGEMGPFYHGTSESAYKEMLKTGYLGLPDERVYLSRFPDYASYYAFGGDNGKGALLKISKVSTDKLLPDEDIALGLEDSLPLDVVQNYYDDLFKPWSEIDYTHSGKLPQQEAWHISEMLSKKQASRMGSSPWVPDAGPLEHGMGTVAHNGPIPMSNVELLDVKDFDNAVMSSELPSILYPRLSTLGGWEKAAGRSEQLQLVDLLAQLIRDYPKNKDLPWWLR